MVSLKAHTYFYTFYFVCLSLLYINNLPWINAGVSNTNHPHSGKSAYKLRRPSAHADSYKQIKNK